MFSFIGSMIKTSPAYPPQTDGQTEVMNRKLEEMIWAYLNIKQSGCNEHIIKFKSANNSSKKSISKLTPFFLTYGDHSKVLPLETLILENDAALNFSESMKQTTREARAQAQRKNRFSNSYTDKNRSPCSLIVGQNVRLSTKKPNTEPIEKNSKL